MKLPHKWQQGQVREAAPLGPPLLRGFPSPELLGDEGFLWGCIPLSTVHRLGLALWGRALFCPSPGENGSSPSWVAGM